MRVAKRILLAITKKSDFRGNVETLSCGMGEKGRIKIEHEHKDCKESWCKWSPGLMYWDELK